MSMSWVGKALIRNEASGAHALIGRIILVNVCDDLVVIARAPRVKKNGYVDNYVPSPERKSLAIFSKELQANKNLQIVEFEPPPHWLWSEAQLRGEIGDGLGHRNRRNIDIWRKKGDAAFAMIASFVEGRCTEEVILDPALSSWPAVQARASGEREVAIRRALNAYLFGMGNRRALLPGYTRSGGPGKQKFSRVDTGRPGIGAMALGHKRHAPTLSRELREQLKRGWRKYKKPGVSVAVALDRTLADCMAESIVWNGTDCQVKLKPEATDITAAMFRYWGTHDADSLTAQQIEKGQTLAKKEYLRRLKRQKGRLNTVNGCAFLDSTSTDQTLRSEASSLRTLSAPWRTEVLGAGIDYIFGIHVGFEATSATTALLAILHAATDKVAFCARFGHAIEPRDWYSFTFNTFLLDNGEGKGKLAMQTFDQLETAASYGSAYDAINKAMGEAGHRSRQRQIDHLLPGSTLGCIKRRGEPDRSQFARYTFDDYMHLFIQEVLFKNNQEHIDPPRLEMYEGLKERTRRGVLEWMVEHHYVSSAPTDLAVLRAACLPRLKGSMTGAGVRVFNPAKRDDHLIPELVYQSDWLVKSGILQRAQQRAHRLEVHLNPSDLSHVWVNINGMKRLDLVSNDPDLFKVCLIDWLIICGDNQLRGYLSRAKTVAHRINKVVSITSTTQARSAERRKEIQQLDRKLTKSELKKDRTLNTAIEAAAHTGVPKPLPSVNPDSEPVHQFGLWQRAEPTSHDSTSSDINDILIAHARSIFESGSGQ